MRKDRSTVANLRYWATVLSACSIGETVGDLVSHEWGFGYVRASLLFLSLFTLIAAVERRAKVQNHIRYWMTIVIMSTTGTALADLFTRTLKLGYTGTSTVLLVLFTTILLVKYRTPRAAAPQNSVFPHIHLHLEKIDLPDTDFHYWAAIMVASTLGTSLGDFTSNVLNLGFDRGSLFLGGLLSINLIAEHFAKTSNEARYWAAMVLTSTIGATSGDFFTKVGGMDWPFVPVITTQILVFGFLIFTGKHRDDRQEP